MTAVTSADALAFLDDRIDWERSRAFHQGRVALDAQRMPRLLERLGPLPWPEVCVHVAGSEGKTSTTELIGVGLARLGLSTGCYTSPHLRDVRERLRIDGGFPPDADLIAAAARVRAVADEVGATWFECLTAIARLLFVPPAVQAAVWETGLGGRLDATRALQAHACVITSISLEHTAILGTTLSKIAAEKAGILRPGVPLVLGAWIADEARAVIEARATALGCALQLVEPIAEAGVRPAAARNRALAEGVLDVLAAAGRVPPRTATEDAALAAYSVRGRHERRGRVLYDGAHTVAATRLLAESLAAVEVDTIVFGATSGRDAHAMLAALRPLARRVIVTRAPGPRGVSGNELLGDFAPDGSTLIVDDPHAALALARSKADGTGGDALVLVTGSLHLVGALLEDDGEGAQQARVRDAGGGTVDAAGDGAPRPEDRGE